MPDSATPDQHAKAGQIARAARIEEEIEQLQKGEEESQEPASIRERLDRAAAEFKAEHKRS